MDASELLDNQLNTNNVEIKGSNSNPKKQPKKLLDKLRNRTYLGKVLQTLCIAFVLFILCLQNAQRGQAFLDLQLITNTNVEEASRLFTAESAGYLTGACLCGTVLSKRMNQNLLLVLSMTGLAVAFSSVPYCSNYFLMMVFIFLVGVCDSTSEINANAQLMRLWKDEERSMIHIAHFGYSFGGIIAPFITEPFLAKRLAPDANNTSDLSTSAMESRSIGNSSIAMLAVLVPDVKTKSMYGSNDPFTYDHLFNETTETVYQYPENHSIVAFNTTHEHNYGPTSIHIAFLITGILSLFSAFHFLTMFCLDRKKSKSSSVQDVKKENSSRQLPLIIRVILVAGLFLYFFLYCATSNVYPYFLMTFLVREFDVSKSKVAYMTGLFYLAQAAGQFVMFFTAPWLSPVKLVVLTIFFMLSSFTAILISVLCEYVSAVFVLTGVFGFSCCAFSPAFTWCESELLHIRGALASVIMFAASLGVLVGPLLLGVLMQRVSNMWFCYLLEIEIMLLFVLVPCLLAFNRLYVNKKYGCLQLQKKIPECTDEKKEDENGRQALLLDTQNASDHTMSLSTKSKPI